MPDSKFNKQAQSSRLKIWGADNPICKMPICDPVVKKAFLDCGVAMSGSMSMIPISWTELSAYCQLSKTDLTAWEADHVIAMSREYCSFIQEAKSETCPQPYWPEMTSEELKTYQKSLSRITSETEKERDQYGHLID